MVVIQLQGYTNHRVCGVELVILGVVLAIPRHRASIPRFYFWTEKVDGALALADASKK